MQRAEAGAEVVEGDAAAELGEIGQEAAGVVDVGDRRGLRDLEDELVRIDAGAIERRADVVHAVHVGQRAAGEVDVQADLAVGARAGALGAELLEQRDGLTDDPAVDHQDHPSALGHRQEGARRDDLAGRPDHAQQQLEVRDRAAVEIEDRLGIQRHVLVVDRTTDPLGPGRRVIGSVRICGIGAVDGAAIAAVVLGLVHREVGVVEQLVASHRGVTRVDDDADAGRRAPLCRSIADDGAVVQRGHDPLGRAAGGGRRRVADQQRELVAAEAGDRVLATAGLAQRCGHGEQQFVAGLVAERVVDLLESVEIDQDHRAALAVSAAGAKPPAKLGVEAAAVDQPGERIVVGEVLEFALEQAALGHVLDLDDQVARGIAADLAAAGDE